MQNAAIFAKKHAFLNRKQGASPSPSKGGEQKREPPPTPPKEGSTNCVQANLLPFLLPPFGRAGVGSPFLLPSFGGAGGGPKFSVEEWEFPTIHQDERRLYSGYSSKA